MTGTPWYELPNPAPHPSHVDEAVSIRGWEPGDGLLCSAANAAKSHPCGAPVAVVRRTWFEDRFPHNGRNGRDRESRYVVCTRHVAENVRQLLQSDRRNTPNTLDRARKYAQELVLSAHWDEYQAAFVAKQSDLQEELLGNLPASLREYIGRIEPDEVAS